MSNLIYGIKDKPKTIKEWIGFVLQFLFSVLPATLLISSICGTSIAAGLVSAGLGTLVFLAITKMSIPVLTSNSGACVSAIVGAIALSNSVEQNFVGVVIGGFIMMTIYTIASILIKKFGTKWLFKLVSPLISGTIVLIIGITLMGFIPTYAQVNGEYSLIGVIIALSVLAVTVFCATKGKGLIKNLPFLFGLIFGYILCIILTLLGVESLIDFNALRINSVISMPDFSFFHLNFSNFNWNTLPTILLNFGFVSLSALVEHLADLSAVGSVVGEDFTNKLSYTLLGDGVSSFVGSLTGAQMTTTYSEYTGTIAVSKCASVYVTLATAISLIALAFITPFNVVLSALPNAVFCGVSIAAYGLIAASGIRNLINAKIDFSNNKNLFIFAAMLSCGVSGLSIVSGVFSLTGIAFAMLIGIVMNTLIKE